MKQRKVILIVCGVFAVLLVLLFCQGTGTWQRERSRSDDARYLSPGRTDRTTHQGDDYQTSHRAGYDI